MTPLNFLHYPYSHSLVALLAWSAIFALLYRVLTRADTRSVVVIAVLVLSHWVLDVLTHRPDMPVSISDSTRVGLGLWNMPLLAVPFEVLLFAAGVWMYTRQTNPRDRQGSIVFLLGLLDRPSPDCPNQGSVNNRLLNP